MLKSEVAMRTKSDSEQIEQIIILLLQLKPELQLRILLKLIEYRFQAIILKPGTVNHVQGEDR